MDHFSKTINASFDQVLTLVGAALKAQGLGVLTEIDVQAAFQKKLGADFRLCCASLASKRCNQIRLYLMINLEETPCSVT